MHGPAVLPLETVCFPLGERVHQRGARHRVSVARAAYQQTPQSDAYKVQLLRTSGLHGGRLPRAAAYLRRVPPPRVRRARGACAALFRARPPKKTVYFSFLVRNGVLSLGVGIRTPRRGGAHRGKCTGKSTKGSSLLQYAVCWRHTPRRASQVSQSKFLLLQSAA